MSTTTKPVYVYGIGRRGHTAPTESGIVGARVTTVDCGGVAAFASTVAGESVRAKRRDLLLHSDVLQEAYANGVVLPLRFGTLFRSEQALVEELLEPRQDELVSLLDRFEGLGELRLRVSYHDEPAILGEIVRDDPSLRRLRDDSQASGQAALMRLGEAVAGAYAERRRSDAGAIVSRLAAFAVDVREDEPGAELEIVRASFLVRRERVAAFDEQLESMALGERHLMTFSCTGPLPPHSFVDLHGS